MKVFSDTTRIRFFIYFIICLLLFLNLQNIQLLLPPKSSGVFNANFGYRQDRLPDYLEWSPDGERVGIISGDQYYIWDYKFLNLETFYQIRDANYRGFFFLPNVNGQQTGSAWSPSGDYLANIYYDDTQRLVIRPTTNFSRYDFDYNQYLIGYNLTSVVWENSLNTLYIGTLNGTIFIWDETDPNKLSKLDFTNNFPSSSITGMWIDQTDSTIAIEYHIIKDNGINLVENYIIVIYDFRTLQSLIQYNLSSSVQRFLWVNGSEQLTFVMKTFSNQTIITGGYDENQDWNTYHIDVETQNSYFDLGDTGVEFWTYDQSTILKYSLTLNPSTNRIVPVDIPTTFNDNELGYNYTIIDIRLSPDQTMIFYNIDKDLVIRSAETFELLYLLPSGNTIKYHQTIYEIDEITPFAFGFLITTLTLIEVGLNYRMKRRVRKRSFTKEEKLLYPSIE